MFGFNLASLWLATCIIPRPYRFQRSRWPEEIMRGAFISDDDNSKDVWVFISWSQYIPVMYVSNFCFFPCCVAGFQGPLALPFWSTSNFCFGEPMNFWAAQFARVVWTICWKKCKCVGFHCAVVVLCLQISVHWGLGFFLQVLVQMQCCSFLHCTPQVQTVSCFCVAFLVLQSRGSHSYVGPAG